MLAPIDSPYSTNLKRIFWLRWIAIAGQLSAIVVCVAALSMALPLLPLLATVSLLAVVNLFTGWHVWKTSGVVEGDAVLVSQLLIDVLALSVLLYFTGGSTNPFVSLYLLPIAIASAVVRPAYVWFLVGVTSLCYSFLLVWYVPLPHVHGLHDHNSPFSLHILGMWLTFILAAALIAWFVVRMAATLRERDRQLARAREEQLRNEQIIGLGTLAAGAAHELGTPLATMAVLAKELELTTQDASLKQDVQTLRQQIDRCKQILSRLSEVAGHVRAEGGYEQSLGDALAGMVDRWQMQHPSTSLQYSPLQENGDTRVVLDHTFEQALHNLMNNAADASPQRIDVSMAVEHGDLVIAIRDEGSGFQQQALSHAGQLFYSTKGDAGFGMGIFLANATIERMGGRVQLANRSEGGACVTIRLPLSAIGVSA
ncbi:MAG: HAMP domain-containing histidine kinase [Gammaproteobacteria bacterium]|nr:MAG: HAMP domain-containing histidine kinase [Gammaproteobacteria bacterium]